MSLPPSQTELELLTDENQIIAVGAAYGTSKIGIGIAGVAQFKPELIRRSLVPVVMWYHCCLGLVVSVLITGGHVIQSFYAGFIHLAVGLSCG
ncbi:hypothetical protein BU17DRAFT_47222 [Hysterangium stoloniferum]|nr:hypothetical protein BU17DRAFT_47222 [Hysterangium stoloniferum]